MEDKRTITEAGFDGKNYFIAVDPYDRLNWFQRILKKIGFYKNRSRCTAVMFKHKEDGTVEIVKNIG